VKTNKPAAVAAVSSVVVPRVWATELGVLAGRITGRFARPEAAEHALELVTGLISDLERKNCWTIAERAGHSSPHALQHLLARAVWDTDGVRDDLRSYVVDRLTIPGEQAVLVVDETGDLKKGTATVGVQRQYTGTAGRIENAQVAVYLGLVGERGHTFIDRALYLPKSWTEDPDRRQQAGVPDDVTFATKPVLAAAMITRAVTGGVPVSWVTGDEVYGACPQLRDRIRRHGLGYVLAVASNHRVTYPGADEADLAGDLARTALRWQRLSAGVGSKGLRYYSWARIPIKAEAGSGGHHWLLIRRNDTTSELAYYRCYHPTGATLADLVAVAGKRWRIEESFQTGKGHVGLDQHQVRNWNSWHRWTTLAMLAHALLTVLAATIRDTDTSTGLIPITLAEVRHLLRATHQHLHDLVHTLTWSTWRRRHQYLAQRAHYRRRGHPTPQPDLRL